ncbi:DUF779 domain-containing protein [Longirhabdus pacifica]|uniref:DUF779 domain-containing protein n=1 Tax=Longirhabdus pacifica TaxID=2305227 RepID=UPI001008F08C|nr:DUF779 domain-containing protein [Longirhabdus pacifica]
MKKVIATQEAISLIGLLKQKHGDLLFHQSGGCCDGSTPMCYPRNEFMIGDNDVHLGDIAETPFYISKQQYEYMKHTVLIVDAKDGVGGMFSLESAERKRFFTHSEVISSP